jgi:hypothetical protein
MRPQLSATPQQIIRGPQVAEVDVGTLRRLRDALHEPELRADLDYLIDVAEWAAQPLGSRRGSPPA